MTRSTTFAFVSIFFLTACQPFADKTGQVSGSLEFSGQPVLAAQAVVTVFLEDVSLADAPALVVASSEIANPGEPPITFSLEYTLDNIDPNASYGVRAQIHAQERLLFTSDTHTAVLTRGFGNRAEVFMKAVHVLPAVGPQRDRLNRKGFPALTGMFRYMADAALFRDCASNRSYPVAMEGAYLELETAYLNSGTNPGGEILVSLEGRYEERAAMEGNKREINLVVSSFHSVSDSMRCEPTHNENLLNTYWKLLELNREPVRVEQGQREPHMILKTGDEAPRVEGSTGCNRFFGGFETEDDHITFGRLGATLMACPDTRPSEQEFMSVLESTDRYTITGQTLALYQGDQLLAYFGAVHLR